MGAARQGAAATITKLSAGARTMENLEIIVAQPIAALVVGIVILLFPRVLSYAVAAYLIFIGVTGLWPNLF